MPDRNWPDKRLDCDVLVVGAGAAGLSAAVSASREGARTVVLEKAEQPGGTTVLSVGALSAAGSGLQRRRGIHDSPEEFLEDMYALGPQSDNPALRRLLAREAGGTVDWLEDMGVVFAGPFSAPASRSPRMHVVVPNSFQYRDRLLVAAKRAHVTIRTRARVSDAIVADSGRVAGVVYDHGSASHRINARRGVIFASGDMSGSPELRQRYLSDIPAASIPLNPVNTGDGHLIAQGLGAELRAMDLVEGPQLRFPAAPKGSLPQRVPTWRWLARLGAGFLYRAPRRLVRPLARGALLVSMAADRKIFSAGGILVNLRGERFCDEETDADALALQPESRGYLIVDQRIGSQFDGPGDHMSTAPGIAYAYFSDYLRARRDMVAKADDIPSLARLIGADELALEKAVGSARVPFRPPFFALGPITAHLAVTEGSISVDEELRALRPGGTPIPGLYAAGGTGLGGMHLKGLGLHIAWAHTSGRLAGRAAAHAEP